MVAFSSAKPPSNSRRNLPVRILVDTLVDDGLTNAQMSNAREIIRRLDPGRFHVTTFYCGPPDSEIAKGRNTRLIALPRRRQTLRIFREFVLGRHEILFYFKSAPANKYYVRLRKVWRDRRIVVGTVESQSDLRTEPSVSKESIRLWEQTILRSDFLFSNSQSVRKGLEREYGLRSEIVPTGVDTAFFQPDPAKREPLKPRVLFAGSLRPFKQPQLLLEAASRFPHADFVIAGGGIMADELQKRIETQRLNNVTLLGPISAQELRLQYCQADIFLFPSKWEGSPKVLLEAAASGLPVIARRDYSPETVIDGVTGYLAGSDEEMFLRLQELLDDPHLRRKFGIAGRAHSEKFSWDVITRRWEAVFENLISLPIFKHALIRQAAA